MGSFKKTSLKICIYAGARFQVTCIYVSQVGSTKIKIREAKPQSKMDDINDMILL